MKPIIEFIESGVLELYVMGAASPEEIEMVEQMATTHPEVKAELEVISKTMESYALAQAVEPRKTVKSFVMATIDYLERMKKGEPTASPPLLSGHSVAAEFDEWLTRPDMTFSADADDIHAKIIGFTPQATTAIVWLRDKSDVEVHHEEYERFLILEGTCTITVGEERYALGAGDYFEIPLHSPHQLKVTSAVPCKAILQRVAV